MSTSNLSKEIISRLQAFSVHSYLHQNMVANAFKLNPTDMLAIHHLDQNGEMTTGQLGIALNLTSGATTAAVDRLTKAGFVTRKNRVDDRRRVYVQLNKANIQKLKTSYDSIDRHIERILTQFSKGELGTIIKFLDVLSHTGNR